MFFSFVLRFIAFGYLCRSWTRGTIWETSPRPTTYIRQRTTSYSKILSPCSIQSSTIDINLLWTFWKRPGSSWNFLYYLLETGIAENKRHLLPSHVVDAETKTNSENSHSGLPTLRSSSFLLFPTLGTESNVLPWQKNDSTGLLVTINRFSINHSVGKEKPQIFASPPLHHAKLPREEIYRVKLIGNFSLFKVKRTKFVYPYCWHYARSI